MRKIEAERNKNLRFYIVAVQAISFVVLILALILGFHISFSNLQEMVFDVTINAKLVLLTLFCFLAVAVTLYFLDNENIQLRVTGTIKALDLLYLGLPILLSLIILIIDPHNSRVIILVPVLIAATLKGRRIGTVTALLALSFLGFICYDHLNSADLFLAIITLTIGWVLGGIIDVETRYSQQVAALANRDDLTGLLNHRAFHEELEKRFALAEQRNHSLAMVIGDIDNFKHYNDSYGHLHGDRILATIGSLMVEEIGNRGVVARYGGEEFAIILPGRTAEETRGIVENIRQRIEVYPFEGRERQPSGAVTMSFGIAAFPEHAPSAKELLVLADHALYKAKFGSKNKVEVYSSVLHPLYCQLGKEEREQLNSIRTLIQVINVKDSYTYGHSERVVEYCLSLGAAVGLSGNDLLELSYAAYLHDIGKVEISRALLNKKGALMADEMTILQQHPVWGAEIVKPIPFLHSLAPAILHHHENYDGSGYPDGLAGDDIPVAARIIRIANSYDAMTTEKPYGEVKTPEQACAEIARLAGTAYDPELARVFTEIIIKNVSSS